MTKRASDAAHSDSRFPAFWNAFHDWVPDMDHGGVLQMALQSMLMQCEGKEIRLLPAWPGVTRWSRVIATAEPENDAEADRLRVGAHAEAPSCSVSVFIGPA